MVVLGLAIAYAAYWYAIAYYAQGYLAERLDRLGEFGVRITYEDLATSGFPYRLRLTLSDAAFEYDDGPYELVATTKDLHIDVRPWQWSEAGLTAQDVSLRLRSSWANWMSFRAQATSMAASIDTSDADKFNQTIEFRDIRLPASSIGLDSVTLDFQYDGSFSTGAANELYEPKLAKASLTLTGLGLPNRGTPGGTDNIDEVSATVEIHGDSWPHPNIADLTKWRDAGGTYELTNLSVRTGDSIAVGEGSFSLDEDLRVIGALSLILSDSSHFGRALRSIGTGWAVGLAQSIDLIPSTENQKVISVMLANGKAASGADELLRFDSVISTR